MRRIFAASLVSAVLLTPALAAAAAPAITVPADEPAPLTSTLTSFGPAVLDSTSSLTASISLYHAGPAELSDAFLTLSVTSAPLRDSDAVSGFLQDPASAATREVAQLPEPVAEPDGDDPDAEASDEPDPDGLTLTPGSTTPLTIAASAAELDLPRATWGVYGVTLSLEAGGVSTPLDAFVTTWIDTPMPQLNAAVLAHADTSPARAAAVLETSDVPGVAVAADPTVLTNAMVLDFGVREREAFRLIPHGPDITSLAHADDDTLVPFALAQPGTSSLAGLDDAPVLASPGAMDASSLRFLAEHDVAGVVTPLRAPGADAFVAASGGAVSWVDGLPVLTPHVALSTALTEYRSGTSAAQSRIIAEAALAADAAAGQPVLIAPGAAWVARAEQPSVTLEALADQPWIEFVTVESLLESGGPTVTPPELLGVESDLDPAHVTTLSEQLRGLITLSGLTVHPRGAMNEWGADVLAGVAQTARGQGSHQDEAFDEAAATAAERLTAVRVPDSSNLNLLAASGDIPVTVVNGLDRDVTVTVDLRSLSPNLVVTSVPDVTVTSGHEVLVPVPVEAVSSADTMLVVTLRDADGNAVSEVQRFTVRVRADWGNAATAGFSAVLVLLLIAGVVRTIRRGRKDTRAEPGRAPEVAHD